MKYLITYLVSITLLAASAFGQSQSWNNPLAPSGGTANASPYMQTLLLKTNQDEFLTAAGVNPLVGTNGIAVTSSNLIGLSTSIATVTGSNIAFAGVLSGDGSGLTGVGTSFTAPTGVEALGARLYWTPTGGAWLTPREIVYLYDDFGGNSTSANSSGWLAANASGGIANFTTATTGSEVGGATVAAGTSAGGYGTLTLNNAGYAVGRGRLYLETRVRFAALSDGTDSYDFVWGLSDAGNGTNTTDGVFFRYHHATNSWAGGSIVCPTVPTAGAWECWTCKGGASNIVGTAVTPLVTTWYRLGIDVAANASTAKYYVDGTCIATNSTAASMPTTANSTGPRYGAYKYAGSNARNVYIDYFKLVQFNTTTR